MKNVVKGAAPDAFEKWKTEGDEGWEPSYAQLQNPEKQALHKALLAEQGWVCCYCGREVTLDDSHIEHFRPQDQFEALQLSFENLHASCLKNIGAGLPRHCGHAKGNRFDERRIIDPQDVTCEKRFVYTALGAIAAADASDEPASYMNELLSLDIPFLRAARAEVLGNALDAEFLSTASDEDLSQLRDAFSRPDDDGRLPSFGHVIARYAGQYLPSSGL
ncbi:retron system putative HNH endonuclease [Caballeronia sp. LZ034LL]|uniref:retron system putative HNH endonuclease n=1 Tax=Caballeronia sp. LZ034LL TaxID=3038567 RepID=UPI002855C75C|nr:retron system putative HNH endonuclease [Caballeronia sp. LZ034LL]MDR5837629.1 TIGR02646 family protein [Caballeronia sp. LZ034LL]